MLQGKGGRKQTRVQQRTLNLQVPQFKHCLLHKLFYFEKFLADDGLMILVDWFHFLVTLHANLVHFSNY